jgi:phosphoribosyl-ATP pyrophosphohydrolase
MPNHDPVKQFNSPWPAKLKALPAKGVLLIEKTELTYQQVMALVGNMNYRHKGKMLFRVDGSPDTDSIVTCLFHGRGVALDGRKREAKVTKKMLKLEKHPKQTATSSAVMRAVASHTQAIAIIEALYGDGSVETFRAADKEDYDRIMAETAQNMMIVQVQTFALTHTKKRDYSWKDETSPLKG